MMLFPTSSVRDGALFRDPLADHPLGMLISHLLSYKGRIISAAGAGFLVTGLALCFVPPKFDGQAVLILDSRRNKVADAESALSSIVVDQYQSSIRSEVELFLSPELAQQVITTLHLLDTPEYEPALTHIATVTRFRRLRDSVAGGLEQLYRRFGFTEDVSSAAAMEDAANASTSSASTETRPSPAVMANAVKIFQKSFWAENTAKSLTIRLGYRSASPELAAQVTNAALERYLALDAEVKAAALNRTQEWLQRRIDGLQVDLRAAEQAVEQFRAGQQLATSRDRSPLQQQLLQLTSQETDAGSELSAARAKMAQGRVTSTVLASRLIQQLRVQEAGLLARQAQATATRLSNNPEVVELNEQLGRVREAIRTEQDRIAQGNSSDVQLAETKLATVTGKIAAVQAKINETNSADIRLRALEAEAAAKRTALLLFTQRYDQNGATPLAPPDSRVVAWATVPVDASSPQYGVMLVAGTLAAAGLAVGSSIVRERLQRGFGGVHELEEELGLIVAGLTPVLSRRRLRFGQRRARADAAPISEVALTVRALAHEPGSGHPTRVVLVTSAIPGEGKTTIALALARSVANGGQRCLLIDADIRNPSLHAMLHTKASPGLVEMTLDRAPIDTAVRVVEGEHFDLLPVGRPTQDMLTPFTAGGFGRALAELKGRYDIIVIDSPPIMLASEGLVLSGCADLTLFVVKWRTTARGIARKAALMLSRCSTGPRLAILSQVDVRQLRGDDGHLTAQQYRNAYKWYQARTANFGNRENA